eukprot:6513786-Prymnesium_polylepis.1
MGDGTGDRELWRAARKPGRWLVRTSMAHSATAVNCITYFEIAHLHSPTFSRSALCAGAAHHKSITRPRTAQRTEG